MKKEFTEILKRYWKSEDFRNINIYEDPEWSNNTIEVSQGEIIENIVEQYEKSLIGKKFKDLFLTAPTGSGKSILFQIPGIYLGEKHDALTLVISPLKSLMRDQVEALNGRGIKSADYINSDLSLIEREKTIKNIREKKTNLLYISPELLSSSTTMDDIIGMRKLGMVVVDEAHTVSTWGRDFRVDYLFLGRNLEALKARKGEFPIIALTATAIYGGENDTVFEIIETLNMRSPKIIIGSIKRENIEFEISLEKKEKDYTTEKGMQTLNIIKEKAMSKDQTIIYFPYTTLVNRFFSLLKPEIQEKVTLYHGKLSKEEQIKSEKEFCSGEKNVMLATKAFGMGIDMENISSVYHFAPTGDLSDYVQEIGRAARKKESKGKAILKFYPEDLQYQRTLKSLSGIKQWQTKLVLEKIAQLHKLNGDNEKLLVDIESFSHIFPKKDNGDLEKKSKLALLAIEKDFYEKLGRNILFIKPKPLFSTAYVSIKKDNETEILDENREKFFKVISTAEDNTRKKSRFGFDKNENMTIYKTQGDIFQLDMEGYWSEFHKDISFQKFQYLLFSGKIFDSSIVDFRKNLIIDLNEDKDIVKKKLLEKLDAILSRLVTLDGYFSKNDLINKLDDLCSSEMELRNISNLLVSLYTEKSEVFGKVISKSKILRAKNIGGSEKYCLIKSNISDFRIRVKELFQEFFSNEKSRTGYSGYIPLNSKGVELGHLLQSMELGVYEIKGGDNPKIKIDIIDSKALISAASQEKYSNSMVTEMERKNRESQKVLENFFKVDTESKKRWEIIENFFLGKEVA